MAEADGEEGGEKLPLVDHGPLNEGAVGKVSHAVHISIFTVLVLCIIIKISRVASKCDLVFETF